MIISRNFGRLHVCRVLLLLTVMVPAGCGGAEVEPDTLSERVAAADTAVPRYLREYIYLGARDDAPLSAPFVFESVARGDSITRSIRAGLALGATWDIYLDENWSSTAGSGVWRVLPRGDLQMAVGGPAEIESFWYRRGERSLRLELQQPLTGWNQGDATRFRLVGSHLELGPESSAGIVLETLEVQRPRVSSDADRLFLIGGDSIRLVLSEPTQRGAGQMRGFAWLSTPTREQMFDRAEIRWLEMRSFEEARRDVPLHWSFRIPDTDVHGEVSALGFNSRVGPDRPGRRSVEIRYTVEGWIEIGEERDRVVGVVRHVQR